MGGIKIDKLTEKNFHDWRQRIKMILALRDLKFTTIRCILAMTAVLRQPPKPAQVSRSYRGLPG